MSRNGRARELRALWEPLLDTIKGQHIMLVNLDSGITWGGFLITDFKLNDYKSFELILFTTNEHTPQITINSQNPWQAKNQPSLI